MGRRARDPEPAPPPDDDGMDRTLVRPPPWRRCACYGAVAVLVIGAAAGLLHGIGISTYRVPADQLRTADIFRLMLWPIAASVLAADLIAWPVAYYYLNQWLHGYVYRIA
jgi:hypothetical protein